MKDFGKLLKQKNHQEQINSGLKSKFDLKTIKNRVLDILKNNQVNEIKIFKSSLGFYQIILFDDSEYTIRIHFYPEKTQTKIHSHGYSAYSYVLDGELNESLFIQNILPENPLLNILFDIVQNKHLLNNSPGLDENIKKFLLEQGNLLRINIPNINDYFIKLARSTHTSVSYGNGYFYKLDFIGNRDIKKGEGYFLPASLAHSVTINPGTTTIFIKNKTGKVGEIDFIGGHFISLGYDGIDNIEKGFGEEVLAEEIKRDVLEKVKTKLI